MKPPCKNCRSLYVGGEDGFCPACQAERSGNRSTRRPPRPFCDCGKRAVVVLIVWVLPSGSEDPVPEDMPVCLACYHLEQQLYDW